MNTTAPVAHAESHIARLRTLLSARRDVSHGATAVEAVTRLSTAHALPSADDVLHDFDRALADLRSHADGMTSDERARTSALGIVNHLVEHALDKLDQAPTSITRNDFCALEAVIRADGSRPSLLLRHGEPDVNHPCAALWQESLVAAGSRLTRIASATGRIQPVNGSSTRYFGSGFLCNGETGVVVTNRHVAVDALKSADIVKEKIRNSDAHVSRYAVLDGLEIEFDGEFGSEDRYVFPVRDVLIPAVGRAPFSSLDIAVMRLDPLGKQEWPEDVQIDGNAEFEKASALNSICIVGFPGPPYERTGIVNGIDWQWIDQQLFGQAYGVKRVAPGVIHRSPGFIADDTQVWVFGHDATTLGGNSGSGVFAWLDGGRAFGLHFSGEDLEKNCAHGFSTPSARAMLYALGLGSAA
ncbi:hypothetical protein OKW30_008272 [Paraburkholderia sp. Clong3]|uniref:trypsin-like peptidase domain-containing protein n=1 Tax=Paraburkholderia sp. Clong3 TaxID=2991061 RepID=UPI003D1BA3EC